MPYHVYCGEMLLHEFSRRAQEAVGCKALPLGWPAAGSASRARTWHALARRRRVAPAPTGRLNISPTVQRGRTRRVARATGAITPLASAVASQAPPSEW